MRSGDGWITIESSQADQPSDVLGLEQPESLMQGGGCQHQGKDTINGLAATHYRCDQSRFVEQMALAGAEGTITSAEVELWVADQFNIVVRSVMTWEGATPDGRKLKSHYESVLSDVDKPIQIAKPEGAPEAGVSADIPIPPDIADRMAMPDMVSFRVGQDAQQVADYYQREMAQKGWTLQAEGTLMPSMLVYTQGDRTATITLSEEGSRTTVMITVQKQ
jgi:hypothetical protein